MCMLLRIKRSLFCKTLLMCAINTCFCASCTASSANPCSIVCTTHASVHHEHLQTCINYTLNTCFSAQHELWPTASFTNPCSFVRKIHAPPHLAQPPIQTLGHLCDMCMLLRLQRSLFYKPSLMRAKVHASLRIEEGLFYKPLFNHGQTTCVCAP